MLTVLGGLVEFERHLILARTSEGRARAQVKGIKHPKLTPTTRIRWPRASRCDIKATFRAMPQGLWLERNIHQ